MKSPEPPSPNSGQMFESHAKQSYPESLPLKKKRNKRQETQSDQPNSGSVNLPSKMRRKLGLASGNSSRNKLKNLPVPKGPKKPVDRTAQALKRLGVDALALRSAPEITPILKNAQGGLKGVLEAMRFASDDPTIQSFIEKHDSIPIGDREKISWEAIALAAGLDLKLLLGCTISALQNHSASVVKIIALTSHPKIAKARVKYGLMAGGEKDRTAMDTALGLLPSPKGPTFIGKAVFGSGSQTMNAQGAGKNDDDDDDVIEGDTDDPDLDHLFPGSNQMQQRIIPIRQRLLEDGK